MKKTIALLSIVTMAVACGKMNSANMKTELGEPTPTVARLTDAVSASVNPEDENVEIASLQRIDKINVTLIVGAETSIGREKSADVISFKGQIDRDLIETGHLSHPPIQQKTFSGQIPASNFVNISADLHCTDEVCSQLYAVVKKQGQERALGAFVFHRNARIVLQASDPSEVATAEHKYVRTWDLKVAMVSDLKNISNALELFSYFNNNEAGDADELSGGLPSGSEDTPVLEGEEVHIQENKDLDKIKLKEPQFQTNKDLDKIKLKEPQLRTRTLKMKDGKELQVSY